MITEDIKINPIKKMSPYIFKQRQLLPILDHELDIHAPLTDEKRRQQLSYSASKHSLIPDRKHHIKLQKADWYQGLSIQER